MLEVIRERDSIFLHLGYRWNHILYFTCHRVYKEKYINMEKREEAKIAPPPMIPNDSQKHSVLSNLPKSARLLVLVLVLVSVLQRTEVID